MGDMKKIERISAGVKFESDVLMILDRIAFEQQRTRSFIINAIVRWYVRHMDELQRTEQERQRDRLPARTIKVPAYLRRRPWFAKPPAFRPAFTLRP